ncbi:MAG: hypothetical protein OCU12_05990 [Methanophagales archaeon]|nr:hypothetical protein [Methanophagales archaeon]
MFDGTLQSLLIRMFQEQDMKFIKAIQGGKLVLGGNPSGEYGGPDNPAGFVGKLSQRNVCYDTDEFASSGSTSGGSEPCLVNNLNRIRGGYAMGDNFLENRHVQWGTSGGSISARSIPFSSGSISADNVRDAIGEAYQHGGGGHDFDGNTWIIGDGADADFASPAAAQSDASVADGDVLLIHPGTYDGFTLTKRLTIIGMGDTANNDIDIGRVVVSGLTTAMDIQAGAAFRYIVFEDDDITINTNETVSFKDCRNADYNLTCGAYAVDVTLKGCYLYDVTFDAATGGNLYIRNCDGGFGIDHGAAHLYVDNSDYSPPISGTGLRTTTPNEHAEKTASTASPVQVMDWVADSTGAPAAGFGVRHLFSLEGGAGEGQDAAALDVQLSDPTSGSEDSYIRWLIRVAGAALSEAWRVDERGVLLPSGRDSFPNIYTSALPGRGLASRLINPSGLTDVTCHFRCGASAGAGHLAAYGWDTAAPFGGVPTSLNYSQAGDYLTFTDKSAPWTKHFLRRAVTNAAASWQNKSLIARVRVGLNHWGGIRLDDGTDDNYVEFMIDASSVTAGSRVVFRYRDNAGAVNTVNSAFNTPNTHYYVMQLYCYYSAPSYTVYVYLVAEDGKSLLFTNHSLMGWTTPPPVAGRVGLLCDPTVAAAAGNPVSFDWFYCEFT